MLLALLFQSWISLPWDKLIYGAQGVMVLAIILIFFLKIAPTWKEVKMRELDVREAETAASGQQAVATGQQAESQKLIAEVLYKVSIEQRRASDATKVLQHANSREADNYFEQLSSVEERLVKVEKVITQAA